MAKTTSEIVAENMERLKEEQEIEKMLQEIQEKNEDTFIEAAAKTQAVLDGTSDKLVKNTETTATTETVSIADIASSPLLFGISGFFLGALVVFVFFKSKIQRIRKECETRVDEARAALDRMISLVSKE